MTAGHYGWLRWMARYGGGDAVLGREEGCCVGKAVGRVAGGEIRDREGLLRGRSGIHLLVEQRLLKSLDVGPADVW